MYDGAVYLKLIVRRPVNVFFLFRHKSLIRFIPRTINRIRSKGRSTNRKRQILACLATLSGPMVGKPMTRASTQAREAGADPYTCGRQNVCFGLPKLTLERKK